MVDIDSETLFNGAAAAVATVAVLFFVLNVEFSHSPVTKTALVVAFLAGVFALTQRTDDRQQTLFGYGVLVVSGVALFFDLVNTFDVGDALTVLGLLVLAGVLFALRAGLDEDNRFVPGSVATYAFGAAAVLAVGILVVDVATGALVYELQPASEVEYAGSEREQTRIGTVVVRNPTPLPERVETPNYAACTAGNWSAYRRESPEVEPKREVRAHVHVDDGYNEFVFGYGRKAYPAYLDIDGRNLTGETFPVRTTRECPDEDSGAPYLAVFERRGEYPYARPV